MIGTLCKWPENGANDRATVRMAGHLYEWSDDSTNDRSTFVQVGQLGFLSNGYKYIDVCSGLQNIYIFNQSNNPFFMCLLTSYSQ